MGWMGRSQATGIVAEPLDETMASARRVAADNGLTLDERASSATSLTFKRSVKLYSWGSTLVMDFEPVQPSGTRVSISTKETFALSDWGRGQRLARSILDGLSARLD
jgi:hypothetical protein